ncbi:GIY-YIG nuclease family protein [Vibrio campbellii]
MFYDLKGPIYVGRSNSLRKRYLEHYEKTHNSGLRKSLSSCCGVMRFAWKELPEKDTPEVEKQWIAELNPKSNIIRYK